MIADAASGISPGGAIPAALLLLVTMPLTAAAIAAYASLAMGLPVAAAIVLGAALAPTDPVLAGDVGLGPPGTSEHQPRARAVLTAEAGANDGAALPLLVLGLARTTHDADVGTLGSWIATDVLYAVALAAAWGAAAGWSFAAAFHAMRRRDLLDDGYEAWAAVAAALLLFAGAELVGAYGFVAAFAGGLAIAATSTRATRTARSTTGRNRPRPCSSSPCCCCSAAR